MSDERELMENNIRTAVARADARGYITSADILVWCAALRHAADFVEGGRFLHDNAPNAVFGRAVAVALRALADRSERG